MDPISIGLCIGANLLFTAWRNSNIDEKERQDRRARIKAKFAEIDAKYSNK